MIKKTLARWGTMRERKEPTLHGRLQRFFLVVSVSLVIVFALLLVMFGITGREAKTVRNHIDTELSIIGETIHTDFGRLSLGGISIAEELAGHSERFFEENGISADMLQAHPELHESLLAEYMGTLIATAKNRICGGVFVLLDASASDNSGAERSGIFIKKTQPTATDAVGVQLHYLRGPAQLARDNGIMLLGQWRMAFDTAEQPFFSEVMETARQHPSLALSRLYYWSDRVVLRGNSEAGFLLCVPLRSADGTVFGLCGLEVSDRMFKSLYTPEGGEFEHIFTVMAPAHGSELCISRGLVAGNAYLTGTRWEQDLTQAESHEDFHHYAGVDAQYGGKTADLRLYPTGSPYEPQRWSVSVLMPQEILHAAVKGNTDHFVYIVVALLILSVAASMLISRRYLHPVNHAFDRIKNNAYLESDGPAVYSEISDLFEYLAQKDREHDLALQQKQQQMNLLQDEHERAQTEISRLAYARKTEVDPDNYRMFRSNLSTLTPTERLVFRHYLDGKSAKEIMELLHIKETTLKYHNRNIYDKLGVASRKELLRYAVLMRQEEKTDAYPLL